MVIDMIYDLLVSQYGDEFRFEKINSWTIAVFDDKWVRGVQSVGAIRLEHGQIGVIWRYYQISLFDYNEDDFLRLFETAVSERRLQYE